MKPKNKGALAAAGLAASLRQERAIVAANHGCAISQAAALKLQAIARPGALQRGWAACWWQPTPVVDANPVVKAAAEIVTSRCDVDLTAWLADDLTLAVIEQMARYRGLAVKDYLDLLADDVDEPGVLVEALVAPDSAFFRRGAGAEVDVWAHLTERWLPALARAHPDRPLRAWSAGIGHGEEVWSLAILLAELEMAGSQGAIVLGTDISHQHISAAQAGRYPLDPALLRVSDARQVWFTPDGRDHYRVAAALRQQVSFARHDLTRDPFAGPAGEAPFDLIVCRHVLMFFKAEARHRVLTGLVDQLASGGLLVLDQATPDQLPGLVLVDRQARLWRTG